MKLIIAIIRPDRLNSVLEALYRAEVRGLTVSRVMGHGGETERVENYRGTTVKLGLQEKVRLEIGVSDSFVDITIDIFYKTMTTYLVIFKFSLINITIFECVSAMATSQGIDK